jgi:hypothetical protein
MTHQGLVTDRRVAEAYAERSFHRPLRRYRVCWDTIPPFPGTTAQNN